MNTIPTFQDFLLEIHQSLGLPRPQSKYINNFSAQNMPWEKYVDMGGRLLDEILTALDMDNQAKTDIFHNFEEWSQFHKYLEENTDTHKASQKQVIWNLLFYSYAPGLARYLAFWVMSGYERNEPIDAGMPGGQFWFLPESRDGKVELPIPRVLKWLIDLLGEESKKELAALAKAENNVRKTLLKWERGEVIPKSAEAIKNIFHDNARLNFQGAIEFDENASEEERFDKALSFVGKKNLDAQKLALEIPIDKEQLESILSGNATEHEKRVFVDRIYLRYQKPEIKTIRQRLRVARLVQDGYKRLLQLLCGKEVELTCADPQKNKLLQPLHLFMHVYNLTIKAFNKHDDWEKQDVYFESQLTENEKFLLLSILPSKRMVSPMLVAELLSNLFSQLDPDSPLKDMILIHNQ